MLDIRSLNSSYLGSFEQLLSLQNNRPAAFAVIASANVAFFAAAHYLLNQIEQTIDQHQLLKNRLIKHIAVDVIATGAFALGFNYLLSKLIQTSISQNIVVGISVAYIAARLFLKVVYPPIQQKTVPQTDGKDDKPPKVATETKVEELPSGILRDQQQDDLEAKKKELEAEKQKFEAEKLAFEQEKTNLQKNVVSDVKSQSKVDEDRRKLDQEKDQLNKEKVKLDKEKAKLADDRRKLDGEKEQFASQKRLVEDGEKILSREETKLDQEKAMLDNKVKKLAQDEQQLQNDIKDFRNKQDGEIAAIKTLQKVNDTEKAMLVKERDQLNDQLKQLTQDKSDLQAKEKAFLDTKQKEERKLQDRAQQLDTREKQLKQQASDFYAEKKRVAQLMPAPPFDFFVVKKRPVFATLQGQVLIECKTNQDLRELYYKLTEGTDIEKLCVFDKIGKESIFSGATQFILRVRLDKHNEGKDAKDIVEFLNKLKGTPGADIDNKDIVIKDETPPDDPKKG